MKKLPKPGRTSRSLLLAAAVCLAFLPAPPKADAKGEPTQEPVDTRAIDSIRREGLARSQVMRIAGHLADVFGPRLTGSPMLQQAADWCVETLTEWGITGARLEPWGIFGPGWVNERFSMHAMTPQSWPVTGVPKAWTSGTDGAISAEVVYAPMLSEADFSAWRGKLEGKVVLPAPIPVLGPLFDPPARRFTDADLDTLSRGDSLRPRERVGGELTFLRRRLRFLTEEGAIAVLEPTLRSAGPSVVHADGAFDTQATDGSRLRMSTETPPQVVIAAEHYGRLARLYERGVPIAVELDIRNRVFEEQPGHNVLAELPGGEKRDELVLLGAHLDSWHGATGATDNAVGVAVALEAMRILIRTALPLRRTVRLALWTGEEQGLLGSRAYVASRVADRETMRLLAEHDRISVYFNLDHGAGAIRGVYLQDNQAAAPIFAAWMRPFADVGVSALAPGGEYSTDHVSFDEVGIPAFQFIQDPLEYHTRTHHTSSDTFERLVPADAARNAVVLAAFVYHAATRDERMPRKPLPAPRVRTTAALP